MPQIRCPRCGATNNTRKPGYPFCAGCQDNLARCGYCRWFDLQAIACTHRSVAGIFEVSQDATPPCGYHTPREDVQVRRWGVRALVWVGLTAAVFALGYGLLQLFTAPAPPPPGPELQLAVEADYRAATVGQPYLVQILIYNVSDVVVSNVRLQIAEESLEVLYLREIRPQPLTQTNAGNWRVLSYPKLNPRERRRIALELVPRLPGPMHLVVGLLSGEDSYHGRCDLPMTVAAGDAGAEAPSSTTAGGEGE